MKYIDAYKLKKLLANRYEEITVPILTDKVLDWLKSLPQKACRQEKFYLSQTTKDMKIGYNIKDLHSLWVDLTNLSD